MHAYAHVLNERGYTNVQQVCYQLCRPQVEIRIRIRPTDVFATEVNNNRLIVDNAIALHDRYLQARAVEIYYVWNEV